MKRGLCYTTDANSEWQVLGATVPMPLVLAERIRIFVGFRDRTGRSRIGFWDVDAENPSRVLDVSKQPSLDIGEVGMFDQDGVQPTAILMEGTKTFLYYSGYHRIGTDVRFTTFTGLSICEDDDPKVFERIQRYPVCARAYSEELFRAIHSIIKTEKGYKVWYGGGNSFLHGKNKTLPVYDIHYMQSDSKFSFPSNGQVVIEIPKGCHRVGRPYVFHEDNLYKIFYGYGSEDVPYRLAYAESNDGIYWLHKDLELELDGSGDWDSQNDGLPGLCKNKK